MPTCRNCDSKFPIRIKIGDKWKSLSKRKYCLDCSPYNLHNTKKLNKNIKPGTKKCPICNEVKELKEFYRGGKHSYCIPCSKQDSLRRKNELKKIAVEYKGGKCQECGYSKCIDALEFHHHDRVTKEFGISDKLNGISLEKLKIELDKCELLCCRCHREKEAELRIKNKL